MKYYYQMNGSKVTRLAEGIIEADNEADARQAADTAGRQSLAGSSAGRWCLRNEPLSVRVEPWFPPIGD